MKLLQKIRTASTRSVLLSSGAMLAMALSLIAGPLAPSAAAVSCRVYHEHVNSTFLASNARIAGKVYYSSLTVHTVPSTSGCLDINVANITSGIGSGGHCAYFSVDLYNSNGNGGWVFASRAPEAYACSASSSVVVPVVSSVPNGKGYIIWSGVPGVYPAGNNVGYDVVD